MYVSFLLLPDLKSSLPFTPDPPHQLLRLDLAPHECQPAISPLPYLANRLRFNRCNPILSLRFLSKCLIALGVLHSPVMDGVVPKTTAQVRDKDGGYSANGEKIVVFLLGFKSNHSFGIFAPGFKEIRDYFYRMSE
jgi:hypothetical protein